MNKSSINRRDFLSSAALIGAAGTVGAGAMLSSCCSNSPVPLRPEAQWNIPSKVLPDKADDGKPLRAGIIGCGGRGKGAAQDFLNAGPNLSVVALGDVFRDRIDDCRNMLKNDFKQDIADNMLFDGFDNYKGVLAADIDVVIIATPPAFRPTHFKAAVDAKKHVFLEKPLAVDPAGAQLVIVTSKQAFSQGLCVITGTQRHHDRGYIEGYRQVQSGMIGDIVSGNVYWNQQMLWYRPKQDGWSDMEWMIRDWVNWTWLSGDHIVEQHVHNIDVFNWFSGLKPERATGFGARQRRITGDQYDMFSVDFVYEGGVHCHSMCRQINGCSENVSERIQGTKGIWTSNGVITDLKGKELWKYDKDKEKQDYKQTNPYVLEHVNWVNHIRAGQPISQAEETAVSNITALMGRISAYRGVEVTWDDAMAMKDSLVPDTLELKDMDMTQYVVPVPGIAKS